MPTSGGGFNSKILLKKVRNLFYFLLFFLPLLISAQDPAATPDTSQSTATEGKDSSPENNDEIKKKELYEKKCGEGIKEACFKLAQLYEKNGYLDEAFKYYKSACDSGFMESCYQLAISYEKDQDKKYTNDQKLERASKFYKRACQGGYLKACQKQQLDELKVDCDGGKVARCFELASYHKNKGAEGEAIKLFTKACQGGDEMACMKLEQNVGSEKLFWASIVLIGLAVVMVTYTMFHDEEQYKAAEKLEEAGKQDIAKHGAILRYSRPFFKRYVTPIVSGMKNRKRIKEKYKRKLASSGLTEVLSPEDFYSFKLFLIVAFPILFLAVRHFLEETWPLTLIPILSTVGYLYPDIWVNGKIQERQKSIIMSMPFCVDMLALSVEAGLDFVAAMSKVNEKAKPSALTEEFAILIKEIKIGSSRAEALRTLAWRIDLIQISSFCATLIAADSVGASIGPILKALSGEIRQKKSAEVEKAGATAATKILFPMLFLIVPAVFLIVAAPMGLEMVMGNK